MHRGGKGPHAFGEMPFNLFTVSVTGYEQGRKGVHLGADQSVLPTLFLLFGRLSPLVHISAERYLALLLCLPSLQEFWVMNTSIQSTIILLIEQIVVALGGEFKLYLPQLIPHMLRVFMHDNSPGRIVSIKASNPGHPLERFLASARRPDSVLSDRVVLNPQD